jgi:hypothetical protein
MEWPPCEESPVLYDFLFFMTLADPGHEAMLCRALPFAGQSLRGCGWRTNCRCGVLNNLAAGRQKREGLVAAFGGSRMFLHLAGCSGPAEADP